MSQTSTPIFNAEQTSELLDYADMVAELKQASIDLERGDIQAPERQAVEYPAGGLMLSMPATAPDIGIHKLVNVVRSNPERGLPIIHGVVAVYDGETGTNECILHGQTVTARRTAAVSMLGLDVLLNQAPRHAAIVGYGTQGASHTQALARLYPGLKVTITGRHPDKAQAFIKQHQDLDLDLTAAPIIPDDADVVITVTTSDQAFYNENAHSDRLIVAVGAFRPDMAEIGVNTLSGSQLFVDELAGAKHEAGDYLQADVDWNQVTGIVEAVKDGVGTPTPRVYKTVGCAAWDLAAARAALSRLKAG